MKKFLIVLIVLFATTLSFAQDQAHKLNMDRGFFTTDYTSTVKKSIAMLSNKNLLKFQKQSANGTPVMF